MITTYSLGDAHSHKTLAPDLRSHGFDAEVVQRPGHHAHLTVTHEADESGDLDERVYAAAPFADIIETVRPAEVDTAPSPSLSLSQPRHRSGGR